MKIEMCDEFFYRINNSSLNLFNEFNTSQENVLRNNNKIKIYNGEWVKIKVNDFVVHHVKPMQTLSDVAREHSMEIDKIIQDNNLKSNRLFIGQMLKIYK